MLSFKQFILNEMPRISLSGKSVLADDKPLKDFKVEDLKDNIVVVRTPKKYLMFPAGFTMVYFMDSKESADEMRAGKIPYLRVPIPHSLSVFAGGRGSPINDVWGAKMRDTTGQDEPRIRIEKGKEKKVKGTDKILGLLEGLSDENEIHVSIMSVRKPYRKNTITAKMIEALKKEFPSAKIMFDEPSDDGQAFIDKRYPEAEITKKGMWKWLGRF
jgi:hypothetical protein